MKRLKFCTIGCGLAGAALVAAGISRQMRRMDFKGASVVITGGSRGLGLELARLFAAEGAKLSLLARDVDELERAGLELEQQGADVQVYRCDVADRREVEQTVAAIAAARGRIDVLVNNAGIIQVAPAENMDLNDYDAAMKIHTWGPLYTILAVTPHMKRQRGGRIVNISSIGGLVSVPHLLPYCMSKFALTALSDGMRAELARYGIRVTTVAPGLMRTGSHVRADFKGQYRKEFGWFSLSGTNPLFSANSRRAAREIVAACRYGKSRLIISLPAKLLNLTNAALPGLFASGARLAARVMPGPAAGGNRLHSGLESTSAVSPSILTRLGDLASRRNNEV